MEPGSSLPYSQRPATGTRPSQLNSVHTLFKINVTIILSSAPKFPGLQVYQLKFSTNFSHHLWVLQSPAHLIILMMLKEYKLMSRFIYNNTRGMDWWMDLLTTYTHDSELGVITAQSLISTLYKSLHTKSSPVCSVFTSRCLVTNLNNGDSSASVVIPLTAS
jgi:hypothetical protein